MFEILNRAFGPLIVVIVALGLRPASAADHLQLSVIQVPVGPESNKREPCRGRWPAAAVSGDHSHVLFVRVATGQKYE